MNDEMGLSWFFCFSNGFLRIFGFLGFLTLFLSIFVCVCVFLYKFMYFVCFYLFVS